MAEFVIHLASKAKTEEEFKKELVDNGAEMTDVFIERLWTLIQHMTVRDLDGVPADVIRAFIGFQVEQYPCLRFHRTEGEASL